MMLRQIQHFQTIVQENSFTEAAELCHISQSGISQSIKALEEEIGVKLIVRKNRSFELTKAGEHFFTFLVDSGTTAGYCYGPLQPETN